MSDETCILTTKDLTLAICRPQLEVVVGRPTPRKLSAASARIA